jgi:hypothetical protein
MGRVVRAVHTEEASMQNADTRKRPYTTPRLLAHGTLEEVTQGCNKQYGTSDGFTFMGQAIVCVS